MKEINALCVAGGDAVVKPLSKAKFTTSHIFSIPMQGKEIPGRCVEHPNCKLASYCTKEVRFVDKKKSGLSLAIISQIAFTQANFEDMFLYPDFLTLTPKEALNAIYKKND